MANPTTNFGWVMPSATDLVTDLPADFDVFGQAVDTDFVGLKGGTTGQVLAKASGTDLDFVWSADAAGMTNPMTTTADIIYSSSGSTPARLGIGSTDDVLTVAGGVPTWAAPGGGWNPDYTLLNSGNTALSGAGSTKTISGISGKNAIYIRYDQAHTTAAYTYLYIRLNGSTTASDYYAYGILAQDNKTLILSNSGSTSYLALNNLSNLTGEGSGYASGAMQISGTDSTGVKPISWSTALSNYTNVALIAFYSAHGHFAGASAISSITIGTSGTFDGGDIYIYGA